MAYLFQVGEIKKLRKKEETKLLPTGICYTTRVIKSSYLSVVIDKALNLFEIGNISKFSINADLFKGVAELCVCTSVEFRSRDEIVSRLHKGQEGVHLR